MISRGVVQRMPQNSNAGVWKINGLGDSITGRNQYHPFDIDYTQTIAPLWAATTGGWIVGNIMRNSQGTLYYCSAITTGITGSSEPTATSGSVSDGGVTWQLYQPYVAKDASSFLAQCEFMSNGRLVLDLSNGYAAPEFSLVKMFIIDGGSNYTAPTISFTQPGVAATLQTTNGVITGYTITNAGRFATGTLDYTISDATGSGAVLSLFHTNSGTFGVSGCRTRDMVARLADVCAANFDICTVLGGTNDLTLDVTSFSVLDAQYAITVANLKTCYETLVNAGKVVVAIPILPRTGLAAFRLAFVNRVNNWIRAYARKEVWANPRRIGILLADCQVEFTDSTTPFSPVGGSGGSDAYTTDGLHPSPAGAQVIACAVIRALEPIIGRNPTYPARCGSYGAGYDLTYNKDGNILEGLAWTGNTAYGLGSLVTNDSGARVYRCTTAGTSAGSGGPTGTGGSIADGTVVWGYVREAKMSVFGSGTAGTQTAATGITYVGSVATGYTLARAAGAGTDTVTITCAIENPWSSGQKGTRQSLDFAFSAGVVNSQYRLLILSATTGALGIQSSQINNDLFTLEVDLEVTNASKMYMPFIQLFNNSNILSCYAGYGVNTTVNAGREMLPSTGNPVVTPNNGRFFLRTQPTKLPVGTTNIFAALYLGWNSSGGATATGTVKINYVNLKIVPSA